MKRREVLYAFFVTSLMTPLGGDTSINPENHPGVKMYTGIEPGFLTVFYLGKEVGIPIANCRTLVWAPEEVKK